MLYILKNTKGYQSNTLPDAQSIITVIQAYSSLTLLDPAHLRQLPYLQTLVSNSVYRW